MRMAVTGRNGQVVQALLERGNASDAEVLTLARPELDFADVDGIEASLKVLRADAVVNAAAYTAVDLAESEPDLAYQINSQGAGAVASAATRLGIPVIHLSTDYVFDGSLNRPYCEVDPTVPVSIYGKSKLEGETLVAAANPNHAILRLAWVYSPFGKNFARTMLKLAAQRDEISVVSDQVGTPTNALDIADGILAVVKNLLTEPDASELRGTFHMTSAGETTWSGFAETIFVASRNAYGPFARVVPIPTTSYPTPAKRPPNSRLNSEKLARLHGVQLPHWTQALPVSIERLIAQDFRKGTY